MQSYENMLAVAYTYHHLFAVSGVHSLFPCPPSQGVPVIILCQVLQVQHRAKYIVHHILLYMHDIKIVSQLMILLIRQAEKYTYLLPSTLVCLTSLSFVVKKLTFLPRQHPTKLSISTSMFDAIGGTQATRISIDLSNNVSSSWNSRSLSKHRLCPM